MIYCFRKVNAAVERDHKLNSRKMKNFNPDNFLFDVSNICWELIVSISDDVNYPVCEWTSLFPLTIEKHEKCSPWIDKEIRTLIRSRDRPKKAAVKSKSPALMNSYRKARNATNTLNTQRNNYGKEKITACKGDINASWRVIKEIIDKKSKSTTIDYIRNYGQEICSNNEIANVMNDYFAP